MRLALAAIALTAAAIEPAQAYCSLPSAPSCATRYGAFDDEDDFARCRRQMNSYKSDMESHNDCQIAAKNEAARAAEEAARAANAATEEYNETVRRFNRRAKGG